LEQTPTAGWTLTTPKTLPDIITVGSGQTITVNFGEKPVVVTGLQSADIGASPAGSTTVVTSGTDFNVTAGGPGVTGTSDGFRYIYQPQTGNFDVRVQVQSITVAGNFATAGIMARSTIDANSANVYMSASPVNFRFKDRPTTGAATTITSSGTTAYPNVWVRLSRVGNLFTGYTSTDGVNWTKMSSVTLALPTTLDLGLAVASNVNTTTTTAQLRSYGNTVPASVGLQSVDVAASPSGSTTVVTPGTDFNVTAGGPGVTGTSDAFRFIYQQQTGNFDVKVQVQSITVAGNFSTAGIMARSTLDANSADVYMSASPVNFRFKYRPTTGAATTITANGTTAYPKVWVRLSRVGNLFTGYTSTDGVNWTMMSSITVALPATVDLGLAVASNVNTMTTTAQLRGYSNT
jgi:regulation of enolase protein 1 (concanavalin A-like superfamily)